MVFEFQLTDVLNALDDIDRAIDALANVVRGIDAPEIQPHAPRDYIPRFRMLSDDLRKSLGPAAIEVAVDRARRARAQEPPPGKAG